MTAPSRSDRAVTFKAMATTVTLRLLGAGPGAQAVLERAARVFARVEAACTRFDPQSPLMRANADGTGWHRVPSECYLAIEEAARAHRETGGLFDPRVLDVLVSMGYDRTLPFAAGPVSVTGTAAAVAVPLTPWSPGLDPANRAVRLGPARIDLGGIGKGLAVRLAARVLAAAGGSHLIEAGGDCHVGGDGPGGAGWRIGVQDPAGGDQPVAVLRLRDIGCATSSLRVRSWRVDERPVHHLIDPRTGRSAEGGLLSVTVLDPDPARAEVWSKSLLIAGRDRIADLATERGLAALWVDERHRTASSPAMTPLLIWEARNAA